MQSKEKKSPNPKSVNPAYRQAGAKDAKGYYPSTQRKEEVQVIRKPIHLLKQVMKDEQVLLNPCFSDNRQNDYPYKQIQSVQNKSDQQ
jgi:hypothetical protein